MSDTELDDETHSESESDRATSGQNGADKRSSTETSSTTEIRSRGSRRNAASGSISVFLQSERAISQAKSVLILFAATGIGLGIIGSTLSGSVGALAGDIAIATLIPIALVTPAIGVLMGQRVGYAEPDAQPIAVYTLVAIAVGVGAITEFMLASVLTAVGISGTSVSELFVFSFVVALGTVIAGLAGAFTARNSN